MAGHEEGASIVLALTAGDSKDLNLGDGVTGADRMKVLVSTMGHLGLATEGRGK